MKINYFNFRINLTEVSRTIHLVLIAFFILSNVNAQVTITKPNLPILACSGFPSGYLPLGNIVITEFSKGDFVGGTNITLILSAPSNFEFQTGTGTVAFTTGQNISSASITSFNTNTITITYSSSGTNRTDIMTISGLQVRAIKIASTGNIISGGTGVITGLNNGTTLTNTLTSYNTSITTQPTSSSVCTNGSTTFSVIATGATTYQWRKNGINLANNTIYSGVTTSTLNITNPSKSENGAVFDVLVNSATCPVFSNSATLTVFEKVQITTQPITSKILCETNSTTLNVVATGDGLSYQWYKDSTAISGETSSSLTFNSLVAGDGATYYCVVSGTSPCNPVISNNSILIVNQGPVIIVSPVTSQTVCEGNSVSLSIGATNGVLSYQWFKGAMALVNGGTISGANSATLTINPVKPTDADINYNCEVKNGCSTETRSSALIVDPAPIAVATNSAQAICSTNAIATMVLSANISGTTFTWTRDNLVLVTGIAASGSGDISGSLTNSSYSPVTVTFTITPLANGCLGIPITATVLVKPTPNVIVTNSAQTICSTSAIATMGISGSVTGSAFSWTRDNTLSATGIAASGSGNISGSLTNSTNTAVTVTFTITATANGCVGTPTTATVIVQPTTVRGTISQPITTVCANSNNGVLTLSGAIGTIVSWDYSTNGGVFWTSTSNTTNSLAYSNLSQTTLYRVGIRSGTCPTIYSTNAIVSVIPSYIPTTTVSALTICAGDTSTLSATIALPTIGISNGTFDNGNPNGWCVNGLCSGSFMSANGDNQDTGIWRETNNHAFNGVTYNSPNPKFAIANGSLNSTLETPIFSLIGQSNANFQFLEAYLLEAGASAKIEISTDAGVSYTSILAQYNGASNLGITGSVATMQNVSLSLANYIGLSNLKIKFTYSGTANSGWILDSIVIPNTPPNIIYTWTPNATLTPVSGIGQTVIASPSITTTYSLTTTVGGCSSASQNITITVNQKPIVTATPSPAIICSGDTSNIVLTSSESGTTYSWTASQTNVTGASAGSGNLIAQTLTATGTLTGTVVYTISSTSKGCIGIPKIITVTVNPRPTAAIQTSQTICSGETTNFKVLLSGTAPWNITYSYGTPPISTTTTTSSNPFFFSIPNITTNRSYTITALSDANCTAKLADLTGTSIVTILNGTAGLWTGLVSTDWFDCHNWAGGLPSNTIDAQIPKIPSGGLRMPVIDRTSTFAASYNYIANARDIIIETGASVTMVSTNNSELQISQDWKNSGTFIPGTGTVTFNGNTANQIQNINYGIKNNETFYNLTTNNTGGAKGISVIDDFELTVFNDLSLLSGDIRLTGEAQLVQSGTAANTNTGSGKLYRDQQGQQNSFNYNYWSSPVSSSADFTHYSVNGVLKDGTDITNFIGLSNFNQESITFGDGAYFADGSISNPIKISNRWLWSYGDLTPVSNTVLQNYNQWNYIGNTGLLAIGEGFTMKGTGGIAPITSTQNYVFIGKPNSGTITIQLPLNDTHLIGNPYPSALDADEFIKDNIKDSGGRAAVNVFSGALYFWDHFGLSNNHLLAQYEGGYATYTLVGGVNAIANVALTANNGISGSKIPKRYIPVGQGFFVNAVIDGILPGTTATVDGGTIVFKNSQRAFVRESSGNSLFMKTSQTKNLKIVENTDTRSKIRLGFNSSVGKHRQLLVGEDANATDLFDIGYDAPMYDTNDNDMFWKISESQFVIQAIPDFDIDRIIPLGIVIANEGLVTIKIDALENIPNSTKIYLFDNTTGIYHPIKTTAFTISLPVGQYNNRFSISFSDKTLKHTNSKEIEEIKVLYSSNYKILTIQNNSLNSTVNLVNLFNMQGQSIAKWNVQDSEQTNIQIPIKNISAGIYVVKIRTSKGESSTKIIVN